MSTFLVPAGVTVFEQVIKKSRFITYIAQAADPEAAHAYINSIRQQYPDARHVCWAFIAGEVGTTPHVSCSDDGEPNGTAGKPMLNVLQHGGVGEVVAVVVRYFGGIKLGTGGLVRAYSSSVSEAMQRLTTVERIEQSCFTLELPYALEDVVRRTLQIHQTVIDAADYQQGLVLQCTCPTVQLSKLLTVLGNVGRGKIQVGDVQPPPTAI